MRGLSSRRALNALPRFCRPFEHLSIPPTNETTVGIHLDAATLENVDYVDVLVTGRYITRDQQETLGIEVIKLVGLLIRGVEMIR